MFLGITTIIAAVYGFINSKEQKILKGFLFAAYLTICVFYVKFCFDYPFICTMNFRYLGIAYGVLTILYALGCDRAVLQRHTPIRLLVIVTDFAAVLWAVFGSALYFWCY